MLRWYGARVKEFRGWGRGSGFLVSGLGVAPLLGRWVRSNVRMVGPHGVLTVFIQPHTQESEPRQWVGCLC